MAEIDPLEVYKLRKQQLTFKQIGQVLECTPGGAHYAYSNLLKTLETNTETDIYANARTQLLSAAEERLLASVLDDAAIEKASLNNRAYALTQIHTMRRLESGKSTTNVAVLSQVITAAKHKLVQDLKADTPSNSGAEKT